MAELLQPRGQFLPYDGYIRFPQHLDVTAIHLANFHAALRARTPTHFRIADVIKRLPGSFKQDSRRAETRRLEHFVGPVRFTPSTVNGMVATHDASQNALDRGHLFTRRQLRECANPSKIIIHKPEHPDLGILHDPGVKDCEETHFLCLCLKLKNYFLRDLDTFTHTAQTIRPAWLHAAQRSDVVRGK